MKLYFISYTDAGIHDPRGTKIAQSLATRGHKITWFYGQSAGHQNVPGVDFHKIKLPSLPFRIREMLFAYQAARVVSKESFDAGIGFSHIGGLSAYWVKKRTGTPFIFDYPDPLYPTDPSYRSFYSATDRHLASWFEKLEKKALVAAKSVAVISPHFKSMIRKRYGVPSERVFVAPNAPDAKLFTPNANKLSQFTLAYTGKAIPEYGLDWLLESFASCKKGRLLLVVKTEPSWKAWLFTEIRRLGLEKRVDVHENVSPVKVSELIGSAHAAVFPYPRGQINDYASPNKLFEYLALGLPVISRDLPEAEKMLAEGRCGMVVKDSKGFCRAVDALRGRPVEAQTMGKRARALALSKYDWRKIVIDYEARIGKAVNV